MALKALSYIDWVAEYPAAFDAQIAFPCFDTVDTRFTGAMNAGVGVLPNADDFSIFEQADLGRLGQVSLQGDTAFDGNLFTHDGGSLPTFCFENKPARGCRQVIAHEASS